MNPLTQLQQQYTKLATKASRIIVTLVVGIAVLLGTTLYLAHTQNNLQTAFDDNITYYKQIEFEYIKLKDLEKK